MEAVEAGGGKMERFHRFEVCLGYYWYASFGYAEYEEACEIFDRLDRIGYKPAHSEEYSAAVLDDDHEVAREVYLGLGGVLPVAT